MSKTSIDKIIRRDGSMVKYQRSRIEEAVFKATVAAGKPNRKLAKTITTRVEEVLSTTYADPASVPSVEDVQDVVESVLMRSRCTNIARKYIIYRHQRAQLRAARAQPFEMSDLIPYRKIYEVLLWNMEHGCESVSSLNQTIGTGHFPQLIADSESRYTDEVAAAGSQILDYGKQLRVVIIAGPSSSGKTTTMIKINEQLKKKQLKLKGINIDHYFFDLEEHPRDEFGDYDYEAPQALDLALINEHLEQLLHGKTVLTPHYDFKSGKRDLNVHEMKLEKNEILLIDSLHGLYKGLSKSVPDECKFRLYVETLGQVRSESGTFIRWADNRLLRRMIRDAQHRNMSPLQTIMHWHYVRTSELAHIIPYLNTADCVVNTALPYELPLLKARLFQHFPKAVAEFKADPRQRDAYIRAKRVLDMLEPLKSVKDDSPVPATSLLREFIGGSRYRY